MDDPYTTRSPEEDDQLQRSVKKHKRPAQGDPCSPKGAIGGTPVEWTDFLRPAAISTEIYTGKGEDDDTMLEHLEGYEDTTMEDLEGVETG